jgi:hypothetical protein
LVEAGHPAIPDSGCHASFKPVPRCPIELPDSTSAERCRFNSDPLRSARLTLQGWPNRKALG